MTKALAPLWYELLSELDFDALWTAWVVGFCVFDMDGQAYTTAAGDAYLKTRAS